MSTEIQIIDKKQTSVLARLADKFQLSPDIFLSTIKATCKMGNATNEQFTTFLSVAESYNLNPLKKEIWAYPANGGIQAMVGLDGWISIVNSQKEFDGYETSVNFDDKGDLLSATCTMYRKDRARPTVKTVYLKEWVKGTNPVWKQMPTHFLEMRAYVQCARLCFNISGIQDAEAPVIDFSKKYPDAIVTEQPTVNFADAISKKKEETIINEPIVDEETGEIIADWTEEEEDLARQLRITLQKAREILEERKNVHSN